MLGIGQPAAAPLPASTITGTRETLTTLNSSPVIAAFKLPLRAYLDAHEQFDGIAVGAFVFNDVGKLLLVQRAAHDSMPLRWEVPGGACDFEDETLLHAVARELQEESGLRAVNISAAVGGENVFFTRRGLRMCKYSFMVETDGYHVQLDPNEHQAFLWIDEDEARAKASGDTVLKYTTKQQEMDIYEAFRLKKQERHKA